MKDPCDFTADEILPMLKLEFDMRKVVVPEETTQKLAQIARMGIVDAAHGHPVPSSGTIEVTAATTAVMYLNNVPKVINLLQLSLDQLRQQAKNMCPGWPA